MTTLCIATLAHIVWHAHLPLAQVAMRARALHQQRVHPKACRAASSSAKLSNCCAGRPYLQNLIQAGPRINDLLRHFSPLRFVPWKQLMPACRHSCAARLQLHCLAMPCQPILTSSSRWRSMASRRISEQGKCGQRKPPHAHSQRYHKCPYKAG